MNEPKHYRAIMLSSTFTDLKKHRQQAIRAIREFGFKPEVMEDNGARADADVIDSSLQMVRDSVAYALISGENTDRRRSTQNRNPHQLLVTELEFNEAMRLKRPILLFTMDRSIRSLKRTSNSGQTAKARCLSRTRRTHAKG